MTSLFHFVPDPMVGAVLYPLNELRAREPSVWKREVAKYDGREHVMEQSIPPLGCLWNDVLHLTPVHPADLFTALASVGIEPRRRRFFEIDPRSLDPDRAVVFVNRRMDVSAPIDAEQWLPFELKLVPTLGEINEQTRRYYRDCVARGTRPLLYAHLPHVLFRGPIDTRGLRIVEA